MTVYILFNDKNLVSFRKSDANGDIEIGINSYITDGNQDLSDTSMQQDALI
jgi:hypothetical protein